MSLASAPPLQRNVVEILELSRQRRFELLTLSLILFAYAALIVAVMAITVASPTMLNDGGGDACMTKKQFGEILAAGSGGIMVVLCDRLGGRISLLISLLVASAASFGFGLSSRAVLWCAMYFLLRLGHAGGWPATSKLVNAWFRPAEYGTVWAIVSVSSRLGSILCSLGLGTLLFFFHQWRVLFYAASTLALTAVPLLLTLLRESPLDVGLLLPIEAQEMEKRCHENEFDSHTTSGADTNSTLVDRSTAVTTANGTSREEKETRALDVHLRHQQEFDASASIYTAVWTLFSSKRFLLVCVAQMCIGFYNEVQNFVPAFLNDTVGVSQAQAGTYAVAFPVGQAAGVLCGGFLYDRFNPMQRLLFLSLSLFMCMCASVSAGVPLFKDTDVMNAAVRGNGHFLLASTLLSIFVMGMSSAPAYYIPSSVFCMEFIPQRCGLSISIVDFAGYGAALLFNFASGMVLQGWGWRVYFPLFVVLPAAVSMLFWSVFGWMEYRNYQQKS